MSLFRSFPSFLALKPTGFPFRRARVFFFSRFLLKPPRFICRCCYLEESTWEPLAHMNDNCRELIAKASSGCDRIGVLGWLGVVGVAFGQI